MVLLAGVAGCGGSGDGEASAPGPPMRLVAYDSCDALLDGLRRATAEKVGPYGLDDMPLGLAEDGLARGKVPEAAKAPGAAPEHSTTNSHEPGADEPDLVKTDGRRIVALAGGRLRVIDPATRKVVHTLELPGTGMYGDGQLVLSGDRALVLSQELPSMLPLPRRSMPGKDKPVPRPARPMTRLTLVDLSGEPKVIGRLTTEAAYLDARQSGSTVRVVVRNRPDIDFPGHGADPKKSVRENRAAVFRAPLDAWLPAFRVDGNGGPAMTYRTPCEQVSRPASYAGSTMLSVLTFDLARGLADPQAIAVTADGSTVYGNGKSLYVTGTPPRPFLWETPKKVPEQRTDVYKFDVSGKGRPRYVASGSVKGDLLNQYSMSEYGGNLRLATTEGRFERERSESAVHVLAQDGARLSEVGQVGGLGKGERIYSVRFIGASAYVVTFRQVDPLYVLDLKDPRRPRLTGELKITGYSAYLHPMADGRLLGVGRDADASGRARGLQVSLFNVSGQRPRRVASYQLKDASSNAEFEPHAFLYWPRSGLTVIPVSRPGGGTSEALALKVSGTSISEVGVVRHPGRTYVGGVQRSLVVGGTLWTFSADGARATDAATLTSTAWLPF